MTASDPKQICLLKATGQDKRISRGGVAFLVAGILLCSLQYVGELISFFQLLILSASLGIVAFACAAYVTSSIKCPKCRLRWVRWAISHQPHNDWLQWLYRFTDCPECGFTLKDSNGAKGDRID